MFSEGNLHHRTLCIMLTQAICSSQVNETDEMKGHVLPSVGESGIIHVLLSSHASQSPAANYVATEAYRVQNLAGIPALIGLHYVHVD